MGDDNVDRTPPESDEDVGMWDVENEGDEMKRAEIRRMYPVDPLMKSFSIIHHRVWTGYA